MSGLITKNVTLPSGAAAVELFVHNQKIGLAVKAEGGWFVSGKRKPVPTLEEAAKQCLDKAISQHNNEITKLRRMLAAVLRPEGRRKDPQ